MKISPIVSAVIINHNSNGTVLEVIRALKLQTRSVDSILVIDNGSTDAAPAQIRSEFPDVRLMELKENVGLSRARNIGLNNMDADLVLLVDDDVYLEAHALRRMLASCEQTGAAIVCPRVVFYPARDSVQCDGAAIHFAGMLELMNAGGRAANAPGAFAANAFIGACLLVDRRALLALGGFDEDYFFYFEDMEMSYRLRALGHTILCEPNAVAFHDRGAGTAGLSFRGGGSYPARRAYYVVRHRWLTLLLHYQARTFFLLLPALALYELASFAECVRRGWLFQWFRALWWIWSNMIRILKRRRKWQSLRCVQDREILSGGPLPFAAGFMSSDGIAGLARLLDRILAGYWGLVKSCL